jgi:hypothetical protein
MWAAALLSGVSATSPQFQYVAIPGAFAPAIAAIVVRKWVTGEGFADAGLRLKLRRGWPYYLFGWLLPLAVVTVIVALTAILGAGEPDFTLQRALAVLYPDVDTTSFSTFRPTCSSDSGGSTVATSRAHHPHPLGRGRRVEVVQAGQVDAVEVASQHIEISVAKRLYAAVSAEPMVPGHSDELVVRQLILAGEQAKGVRLDDSAPSPGLSTERAVALGRALTQIDIHFITNCSAVATSYVCVLHLWTSSVVLRLFTTSI